MFLLNAPTQTGQYHYLYQKGAVLSLLKKTHGPLCEYVLEYIKRVGRFWTDVFLQHILQFRGEFSSVRSPTYFGQKPLSLRSKAPPLEHKG